MKPIEFCPVCGHKLDKLVEPQFEKGFPDESYHEADFNCFTCGTDGSVILYGEEG